MKAVRIVALVITREGARAMKVETFREDGLFASSDAVIRRLEEVLRERAARGEVAYVYGVSLSRERS